MKNRLQNISFGRVSIGQEKPIVFIAEVACQHGGDMAVARRLIDAAKEAGANIVKFQLHVPEEEQVIGSVRFWAGDMEEVLKKVNFPFPKQHLELKKYCERVGIQYLCTPFCIEAVKRLEKVGVDAYKVGSGELSNLPMLRFLARTKKPIIISTGMSEMSEIRDAVTVMRDEKAQFMLMHTLSEYPPVGFENINLRLIEKLRDEFNVLVGFSDHSVVEVEALVSAAVVLGAPLIEKHFTLDDITGPDDLVSLRPAQFRHMVGVVRNIEETLQSDRYVSKREKKVRAWAHHSVVVSKEIKKGEVFSFKNLTSKRPGSGIPAKFLDPLYSKKLIHKRAKRNLKKDTILKWSDVA